MKETFTLAEIDQAAQAVRQRIPITPAVGIILGSGLGALADRIEGAQAVSYEDIPFWPRSTVQGHHGRLLAGMLAGVPVIVQQGRSHFYEGYSMAEVTLPVRVMQRLGVHTLIVTNAAGGINPEFQPGDVMLIVDQINMLGMAGFSPLRGPNLNEFGPRFPDMSQAFDRELLALARQSALKAQVQLREGVYIGLAGPAFETPAELRFLHAIGADAVGMSTVAEVTVARQGGLRVLGMSGISNKANLDGSTVTTHEEVLEAGRMIAPKMEGILAGVLAHLRA